MKKVLLVGYVVFFHVLSDLTALDERSSFIRFKHLSLKDGLSQTSVICSLQDSKGFLWFGTRDGLNRYNGYEFVTYGQDIPNNGLAHDWIKSIYEDSKGRLWVGTHDGLSRFDEDIDGFINYKNEAGNSSSLSSNNVWDIFEDGNHDLWIATNYGLNRYVEEINSFERFFFKGDDPTSLSDNRVRKIFEDSKGNLWILSVTTVDIFKRSNQSFISYEIPGLAKDVDENSLSCMAEDQRGNLWLGNVGGLYIFNQSDNTFEPFYFEYARPIVEISASVRAIEEDNNGRLWVGTYEGLYVLDFKEQIFELLTHDPENIHSLSQNSIYSITEDSRGDLWIGTWAGGINLLDQSFDVFKHYTTSVDNSKLSYKVVSAIVENEEGNFWIGTEGGGLNHFDRPTERYTHFKNRPNQINSLSADNVKSMIQDHSGRLWIGTHEGGLNLFDSKKNRFTRYQHDESDASSLSNDRVISLYEDSAHNIWVGTSGGLDCFDVSNKKFIHISDSLPVIGDLVFMISKSASGHLFIGSNNGLIKLDPKSKSMRAFSEHKASVNLLSGITVLSVYEDKQGMLWVGTEGKGLFVYNPDTEEFRNYTIQHGLPNNVVYGIVDDYIGNLWISTNNGLARFNLLEKTFKNYDIEDGLQSNEFNYGAHLRSQTGELVFGGVNGFNIFDPMQVKANKFIPPVIITDFLINNQMVDIDDADSPLEKPIIKSEHINLSYDQSEIGFEFVALSYSQPQKNQYAYLLEGFDKNWVMIGNRRRASYTNLPPGEYNFRVKATNNDLVWNEVGASIGITIFPPPWGTWWAYIIYAISTILASFGVYKFIQMRNEEVNAVKTAKMEKEKIEEINKIKLQFFTNISHEFRTPLTLIIGPLERLIGSKEGSRYFKDQLNIMQRNAYVLLRLINQLMDFRKNESGKLKIRAHKVNLVEFTNEMMLAFVEHARYRYINYNIHCEEQNIEAWCDTEKMEEILFNLLSNAFKFTSDHGEVGIHLKCLPPNQGSNGQEWIEIQVADNGCGMSAEYKESIFERFYQIADPNKGNHFGTGIGLALTKNLVDLHHGQIEVESEENQGTTFFVRIPVGHAHFKPGEIAQDQDTVVNANLEHVVNSLNVSDSPTPVMAPSGKGALPTVLVVEDNDSVREYVIDCLSNLYQALEAPDGEVGLAIAQEHVPDLIVSDIMMPKMDGIKMCSLLKRNVKTSHIPVILLTARASDLYRKEGLETGADDYITKPFNPELLLTRVKNLVESRRLLRQKFQRELSLQPKEVTVTSADDDFLKQCVEIVEEHMSDSELNVNTFLDEVGMSRSVFFKKLKALTDQSVTEFVRGIRLKRAAQLLRDSDKNISEVAYMVGFNDLKYFRNCFRKIFKMSPSEYRTKVELE